MLQETCTRMFPWTSPRLIGCPLRCLCRRLHKRRHVHVDVFEISFLEEPLPKNSPSVDSRATTTVQTLEVLVAHHDWVFQNPTLGHFAKERSFEHGSNDTICSAWLWCCSERHKLLTFKGFARNLRHRFTAAALLSKARESASKIQGMKSGSMYYNPILSPPSPSPQFSFSKLTSPSRGFARCFVSPWGEDACGSSMLEISCWRCVCLGSFNWEVCGFLRIFFYYCVALYGNFWALLWVQFL